MKKITDRQNASFIAKLEKSLIKLGAFKSSKDVEPYYALSINTIGGLLYLKIDLDNESFFTLYTMFESLELAKEQNIISIDKHNSKWNFHIVKNFKYSVDEIISDITKII